MLVSDLLKMVLLYRIALSGYFSTTLTLLFMFTLTSLALIIWRHQVYYTCITLPSYSMEEITVLREKDEQIQISLLATSNTLQFNALFTTTKTRRTLLRSEFR